MCFSFQLLKKNPAQRLGSSKTDCADIQVSLHGGGRYPAVVTKQVHVIRRESFFKMNTFLGKTLFYLFFSLRPGTKWPSRKYGRLYDDSRVLSRQVFMQRLADRRNNRPTGEEEVGGGRRRELGGEGVVAFSVRRVSPGKYVKRE